MSKIAKIAAREILNSRSYPTVEVMVELDDGIVAKASCPSGTSVGDYEAKELRDGDTSRLDGFGVLAAIDHVTGVIAPALVGAEASDLAGVDQKMIGLDGTKDKSKLGTNAILPVSVAVARAAAVSAGVPLYKFLSQTFGIALSTQLPTPMFNILNGGKHGAGNLDFQEFMVVPTRGKSFSQSLVAGVEIYWALRKTLIDKNAIHSLGDEGGFAPNLYSNADALSILVEAVGRTHYSLGEEVFLSLDVAASGLYKDSHYKIKDKPAPLTSAEMIEYFMGLIDQFRLLSLEDPLASDDWDGWRQLMGKVGDRTILVGDDLLATSIDRLKKAIGASAVNAVIVKPNQVGTLLETVNFVKEAMSKNLKIVVSHRSGETDDDFIADFAVAIGATYAKFGAPARGERVAKYNRLLEIERELAS